MASLSNTKIKDTYQSLVKFSDNGNITISAKLLTDGFGNNSPLYVSTTQIGIGITPQSGYGLHVSNNVKIGGNLEVSGNLTVNGTLTYLNVVDLEVDDPLIQLAVNNASNILDIGLFGKYVSSGTKYKGLFNDASDDKFKLFTGLTQKPLTTVNTSGTGYTVATLVANLEGNVTGDLTGNADTSTKIASITNSNIVQLTTTQTLTNKTLTSPTITGTGAIAGAFTGDLTGNVTGDITGDITGNLTGDVTGDVTGGLTGNVIGNVTGNLTGNVTGDVTGNAYLNTIAYQGGEGSKLDNSAFNVDGIGTTFRWIESNSGATGTTWKKVADIVITNTITPNGVQMEAKVYQPNTNSGVTAGLNTVYYSIAFRGRIDDSSTHNDAIVYGQDANLLRVYKTADYTFELQARSNDDNRDLVVECNITSKKGGKVTPTITYTDGTATGGTAYTASGNALNKTKFAGNVEFEGAIFDSAEVEDLRVNELLYFGSGATSGYGPHISHSDSGVGTGKGMRITVDSDLQVWGVTGNAGEQNQGLYVAGGVAKLYDMNGVVLETVLGGVDITGTLEVSGPLYALGVLPTTNGMSTTGIGLGQKSNYAHAQFSGSAGGYIDFAEPDVDWSGRIIYTHTSDSMVFYTATTAVLTLDSSNNSTFTGSVTATGFSGPLTGAASLNVLKAGDTMTGDLILNDDVKANFGTDSDLEIYHDGTDGYIDNINGALVIQNNGNDKSIIFKTDNGIGDITEYFKIDGNINRNVITVTTQIGDNTPFIFGSGAGRPSIKYDSTATQLFISGESKFLDDVIINDALDVNGVTYIGSTGVDTKLRVVNSTYYTSKTYAWTNSAIQTTSLEIIDATSDDDNVCATLVMHNYGDGGVKFRMGNTGDKTLYLSSGQNAGAGNPTDDNTGTYFDEMKINNNVVYHAGNFTPGDYLPLAGGTLTGTLNGTIASFSSYGYFGGAIKVPYAVASKMPMIVLNGATTYGLFHTEAASDLFTFDFGGVSKQTFNQNGNITAVGSVTASSGIFSGNISALGGSFTDPVTIYDSTISENPRLSVGRGSDQAIQFDVTDVVATIRHKNDSDSNAVHYLDFIIDTPSTAEKIFSFKEAGNSTSTYLTINSSGGEFASAVSAGTATINTTYGPAILDSNTAAGWGTGNLPYLGSNNASSTVSSIFIHNPHMPFRTDNPRSGATGRAGIRMAINAAGSNWWDCGLIGDEFEIYRNASTQRMLVINSSGNLTLTGDITIGGKTYPKLNLTDNQGVARTFSVGTDNETFTVRNETGSSDALTIAGATNAATFAGTISVASGLISVLGGDNMTLSGAANHGGISFGTNVVYPATAAATNNNVFDFGSNTERWKEGYFGTSLKAPIFYDIDNTTYYGNFAATSNMWQGYFKGKTDGWSLQLGDANTTRIYDDDARASLVINADYYPHLYINANTANTNVNHGAVFSMTGNISGGGFRRWSMGIPNLNPNMLTIGTYDNQDNPHYGCGGDVLGEASWGSKFWLDSSSNLQTNGSMRSPIFYDSDDTGYFGNFAGQSTFSRLKLLGTGLNAAATLEIDNPSSSTYMHSAEVFTANMTTGQTNVFFVGKVGSTKNAGYLGFNYSGTLGSNNNYVSMGLWGANNLFRVYGDSILGTVTQRNEVDFRAPIFYDKDNTTYYGDFAGSSEFNVITTNGNVFNGNTTVSSNNYITFGPNTTWGSSLRVGGNGRTATGTEMASIVTTDGNIHLDAANSSNAIYLNYYAGTGGTFFGTGAGGYVAKVESSGNAKFPVYYDYQNTAYYLNPNSTGTSLNVAGTGIFAGDVVAYSDKKLKTNIKTLDGSKVLKMRGVSFDRIDTGNASSGVIAQEIQEIAPELVNDKNGTLAVAYGNLTGYLIEAIKKQQKQIDELTNIIKKLK